MSLSVQQLLSDAKRLAMRLRDHDDSANRVVSNAQETLKAVMEMKSYQEDIESLNAIAHNRPRPQLVLGIQQENRHIRQLQHENKELRAALEEHQNAIELIMSNYRQQMMCLVNSSKMDKNALKQSKSRMLQERVDKICEMAAVMNHAIRIDEQAQSQEQEVMSRLITENKGLREMLEISCRNGSYSDPLCGPRLTSKECQTDDSALSQTTSALNSMQQQQQSVPADAMAAAADSSRLQNDQSLVNDRRNHDQQSLNNGNIEDATGAGSGGNRLCKYCNRCGSGGGEGGSTNASPSSLSVSQTVNASTGGGASPSSPSAPPVANSDRPVSAASSTSDSDTTSEEDDEITFNTIKRGMTITTTNTPSAASSKTVTSVALMAATSALTDNNGEPADNGLLNDVIEEKKLNGDHSSNGKQEMCSNDVTASSENGGSGSTTTAAAISKSNAKQDFKV